jgi:hypothetical protein
MGIAPRVIAKIMKAKLSPCMCSNIEGFGIAICLQHCKSVALFIVVTIQPLGQRAFAASQFASLIARHQANRLAPAGALGSRKSLSFMRSPLQPANDRGENQYC